MLYFQTKCECYKDYKCSKESASELTLNTRRKLPSSTKLNSFSTCKIQIQLFEGVIKNTLKVQGNRELLLRDFNKNEQKNFLSSDSFCFSSYFLHINGNMSVLFSVLDIFGYNAIFHLLAAST